MKILESIALSSKTTELAVPASFSMCSGSGVLLSNFGSGKVVVNVINEIPRVVRLYLKPTGIFVESRGHSWASSNHIHDQAYTGLFVAVVPRFLLSVMQGHIATLETRDELY